MSTKRDITLRPYQAVAADFLSRSSRAFVVAPAGSGKTIIAASAAKTVLSLARHLHALWVVNTTEQKRQCEEAIEAIECPPFPVVCAADRNALDGYSPHLLIVDEAHHMPAETWRAAVQRMDPEVLWGMSATPWHDKDTDRNTLVRETFRHFHYVERQDLLDDGHLVPARVLLHDLKLDLADVIERDGARRFEETMAKSTWLHRYPDKINEAKNRALWAAVQCALLKDETRIGAIRALATYEAALGRSVLILVPTTAYGDWLVRVLGAGSMADMANSKMPKARRAAAISRFADGKLPILVATSLADEGLDVPRASCLILALGGRSSTKLEQRVGRVLRPFVGKPDGVVHDFMDRGIPQAYQQALARCRAYRKLGYSIEVVP